MFSLQPVQVLSHGADEEKAETARLSSFVGAIAIGDLVKSTLGPKGMDKILLSAGGSNEVTNDGATILKSIGIDNPAAKILVDMSKIQDDEVGDGTTSVVVFASELLREAENLVSGKMHPQTVVAGWQMACKVALETLEKLAVLHEGEPAKFHEDPVLREKLFKIAKTTLSSKLLTQHKDHFANLSVDAVLRLKGSGNLDSIQIIQKLGGTLLDSYLDEGFLLDKLPGVNQPRRIEKAKILVANTAMDHDKIKVFGSKISVDAVSKVAELELAEKEKMKDKVNKIIAYGCNVFINRQLIYNYPEQLFADAGIMAIEHADFDGVSRLALVTGAEIASTFDAPERTTLGYCDLIEEVNIGEDRLMRFSGVKLGEACTIVLRGATTTILAEAERSLHDALCVLTETIKEPRLICGGGAMEMAMANAVVRAAEKTPGKISDAMEAYARALRRLPAIIAENGGYDSAELISNLRSAHAKSKSSMGLDMQIGAVADMNELGIMESYRVKRQVVRSASEAAEMIVRVDDIIKAAPRRRQNRY